MVLLTGGCEGLSALSGTSDNQESGDVNFRLLISDEVNAIGDFFQSILGFAGTTQWVAGLHVLWLTLAVGLTRKQGAGTLTGAAYLFDMITGAQRFELTPLDASGSKGFGISVAVTAGQPGAQPPLAIVGAYSDDQVAFNAGAAYVFDATSGEQLLKFTAQDASSGDQVGYSVGLRGATAIIGAHRTDAGVGSAYLFDVGTGIELARLQATDGQAGDQFGVSVAIDDARAIVGAWLHRHDGPDSAGSAAMRSASCAAARMI